MFKKIVVVTQKSRQGYVAYVVKDTSEEIGRTKAQVEAWATKHNVNIKYDFMVGSVTPYE